MNWRLYPTCFVGLIFCAIGCDSTSTSRTGDARLSVIAGISPLAHLAEQIGGEYVNVDVLVQPGQDPHIFEPTPRQVFALGHTAMFLRIDMPFENTLLEKVRQGNPRLKVVDVAQGIIKSGMHAPCCEQTAAHNHDRRPVAGEPDPHVWLSPPLLKIQAENIAAALMQIDPVHKPQYQRNLAVLLQRIDSLHQRIQRMLAPYRGRTFYVFHPGFGYFADAYGLKQAAVEAGGRTPTPKQLRGLIEEARANRATVVFVQPQFAPQSARAVADAIGAKIAPIDGLGKDVLNNIEDFAAKIEKSLK